MATPGISAGTDGRVKIRDAYLDANATNGAAVIDVEKLTPRDAFENTVVVGGKTYVRVARSGNNSHFDPRGVHVDGVQGDADAQYAVIRGCLRNEQEGYPMTERYVCGQTHPNRYRFIYPQGTTARGIKIHS